MESATKLVQRWMTVGHSKDLDAETAGRSAGLAALGGHDDAKLLVVLCSEAYDLPSLLAEISSLAPGASIIGSSTAGEIATDGPGEGGVVVTALGGPGFDVATAAVTNAAANLREAAVKAAGCLNGLKLRKHTVLMILTDGLAGDQEEIVRGAYFVAGAGIPLVGGCAGDDLKMQRTFQFHNGEVLTDAVVCAAITSDAPMGIGVSHGWLRVGDAMVVTKASGTRVYELNDQPALDAYLDRLNAPAEVREDPAAFTRFALTHPFGVSKRHSEEVRFIAEADFEDRSIGCIARVPEGGYAWIMKGDSASVLDATDEACREAIDSLEGHTPIGAIAFDCIARRGVLGDEGIKTEIDRVAQHISAPVAGFYTYGEIARTTGLNGFHNQTLVVLAIS